MPILKFEVAPEILLAGLRMPEDMRLVEVTLDGVQGFPLVTLMVETDRAPENAVAMGALYSRTNTPDPVKLTHLRWYYVDGSGESVAMEDEA